MEFWDDFSKAVANAADQTVKGTEKLTTIAKLKYRITTLKNKVSEYCKTLGELKYAEYCGEQVSEKDYAAIADEITLINKKVAVLEKRIADLSDYVNCPQCGYRVRRGVGICPYCEYVIDAEAAAEAQRKAEEAKAEAEKAAKEAAEAAAEVAEEAGEAVEKAADAISEAVADAEDEINNITED